MLRTVVGLLALSFSLQVSARSLTEAERLSDLDQLVSTIQSGYGPLEFKEQLLGIRPDTLRARYAQETRAARNDREFYYSMVRFVSEFKDSHFGALLNSPRIASLPISTEGVGDKVYIENVDRAILPLTSFPFIKGDEIVAIDGRPTGEVVQELMKNIPAGYVRTAWRLAAMGISYRAEARFPLPTGMTQLTIRSGQSSTLQTASLAWTVRGTAPIDGPNILSARSSLDRLPAYQMLSIEDTFADFDNPTAERVFRCSGDTRTRIPANATILMRSPFVAYYHPTARGNIGYLRIPHYSPVNEITGAAEFDLRFAQYEWAVQQLEQNTVGLIIDQDHNCGGSVSYLHRIVSLFIDSPVHTMRFRLLANRGEFFTFQSWLNGLNPTTVAYAEFSRVLEMIRTSWNAGQFMTPVTSIDGDDIISPNPIHYTKPIVMLIDELSGSGGDAFPSIMQGIGRAKLLGTRTMGAGGHVTEQPDLFFSRVKVRMTKSLFYRPDGVAVENNGAVPDYPYALTRDDFMSDYVDYQSYYLSVLNQLIP
jgi:hypothetical protein